MIDFVTVVYEQELNYLKTQARSFDVYVDEKDIGVIYVVVNDDTAIAEKIDPQWYGRHSQKLKVLTLYDIEYQVQAVEGGWYTQQLCKLLAVAQSKSEWCCVLDAKTWWIVPFDTRLFIGDDGRFRFAPYKANVSHPWYVGTGLAKYLFNLDHEPEIIPGVPFFMHSETVRELNRHIKNTYYEPIQGFFERFVTFPIMLTEYVLYSAFAAKYHGSLDKLYTGEHVTMGHNLSDSQVDQFEKWIENIYKFDNIVTASIRKSTMSLLSDSQIARWHDFLRSKKLLD
jgi:hypothetical protein